MSILPDHVSDNALHFSSSFLPVLFCCYLREIVSPITDTSQYWCVIHSAVYGPVQLSLQEETQAPILFPLKQDYDENILERPLEQEITRDKVLVIKAPRQMFLILAACAEKMQPWPLERERFNEVYWMHCWERPGKIQGFMPFFFPLTISCSISALLVNTLCYCRGI